MGRPTVGAAVPCRPHGINRVENVENGGWVAYGFGRVEL